MASAKKAPWGDAFAIIGEGDNTQWVQVGPVWENKDGSQTITMQVEPIAWRNPKCERRIQIRQRQNREQREQGGSRSSSRGSNRDDEE